MAAQHGCIRATVRIKAIIIFFLFAVGIRGQSVQSSASEVAGQGSVADDLLSSESRCDRSSSAVPAPGVRVRDFHEVVVPITEKRLDFDGLEARFGTGFCLDPTCRFIGTNYHVAALAHPRKIKGEKIIRRYLATGPNDEGATWNDIPTATPAGIPLKYTRDRDLAIFELRRPLSDYHGLDFAVEELQAGQEVNIYAYPKETINPVRKLRQFHGTFREPTPDGLLAFDYTSVDSRSILPGSSGGIVVDGKTQHIVGVLSGVSKNGDAVVFAVPVPSLAEFVTKVEPYLAQKIFPAIPEILPASADLYPKFVPPLREALRIRPHEPTEVKMLRGKAQLLADSMRNFIAVQTFAWGSGNREPSAQAAYEVRVVNGYQRFRLYPDGKKELEDVPFPNLINSVVPGGEWSELPQMVGTELGLKIHQAADAVLDNRHIKVFQFYGSAEDRLCPWRTVWDFGFFKINKDKALACYGEVWTDENTNILRMSLTLDELAGGWKAYHAVVGYGWLKRQNETSRLIPATISVQAGYKKRIYWCRGQFMNYQVFGARVKVGGTELLP
jgi:hypothetical protein